MGRLPYEKKRAILQYLDSAEITNFAGDFSRKVEWINPTRIQAGLKKMGMGTIGRDEGAVRSAKTADFDKGVRSHGRNFCMRRLAPSTT